MSDVTEFSNGRKMPANLAKMSKNLLVQAFRFVVLNLKMMKMVMKGEH